MPRQTARTGNLTQTFIDGLQPEALRYEVADEGAQSQRGLIVRVYPNGRKAYYLRYHRPTGESVRVKLDDTHRITPKQARSKAALILAEVVKENDPVEKKKAERREARDLGKFIENEFKANILDHRKSGNADLARMKKCFAEFWTRKLNDPTLGNAIINWRTKRLSEGTEPATVNKDIAVLKRVFSWALESDYIRKHPLLKVKPMKLDRAPKVRYLDADEEKRFMDALDAREDRRRNDRDSANVDRRKFSHKELPSLRTKPFTDHLKPMILVSLHTGIRRGELFSLDWQDIDLDRKTLTVRGEVAKSGQTRHIPLNASVLEALTAWHSQAEGTGLIFKGKNGGRFDNANSAWEQLLEDAKIKNFRWHDMRHHFASKLVMAGVDLNTVRELLGHVDLSVTLRYAHLAPHVKAAAVETLVSKAEANIVPFEKAE